MRVVVADDDATTRLLLAGTLKRWGYDVVSVSDGEEAWNEVRKGTIRLVITDWDMPRLDGAGFCQRVRGRREGPYVYILMLTNYKDSYHIVNGLQAGADDFVSKPFQPLELRARLEVGQRILSLQDTLVAKTAQLELLNTQLEKIASTDPLTQLGNRRSFDDALARMHSLATRHKRPYGILIVDIDHFKDVNDKYGHLIGDRVLLQLATTLKSNVRSGDELFRYGGEEIVVLAPEPTREGIELLAERLRAAVETTPFDLGADKKKITVSIGATHHDGRIETEVDKLMKRADESLYRAKHEGRNRTCIAR